MQLKAALRNRSIAKIGHSLGLTGPILFCLAVGPALGQIPPKLPDERDKATNGAVQSLQDFVRVVKSLDVSLAFYRDVVGLEVALAPTQAASDPKHNEIVGTPGAIYRYARLNIPNEPYALLLEEYSGIDRKPMEAKADDPGSSFLNFGFWDGEREFAKLRAANPRLVGEKPIPGPTDKGLRFVWIRDPDGHMIEMMEGGWDSSIKSVVGIDNVYRSHFGMTMDDDSEAIAFYRDILGFDIHAGFWPMMKPHEYVSVPALAKIFAISPAAKTAGVAGHCAWARCEMFSYKDSTGVRFRPRIQDPGAAYLSVWLKGLDIVLGKVRDARLTVVTPSHQPILVNHVPPTLIRGDGTNAPRLVTHSRQIMVKDPAGFLILLMEPVD